MRAAHSCRVQQLLPFFHWIYLSLRVHLVLILLLLPILSCHAGNVFPENINEKDREKNVTGNATTLTVKSLSGTKKIGAQLATAKELADTLAGPGLTILNATIVTGDVQQFGIFNGGQDSIGIDTGVILSTGNVNSVQGPNNSSNTTTDFGLPGYDPLAAFVVKDVVLRDAAVLEINFECTTGTGSLNDLQVSYLFASEEYHEFVNDTFNDVFAFFLNGYETSNNIATLSDGTAVSINSVNCGKIYNASAGGYCYLYVNNENGIFNTQMDGFTAPLEAKAKNLGQDNFITIAIVDAGDGNYDSAVFLEAGSLICKVAGLTPAPALTSTPTSRPSAASVAGPTGAPASGSTGTPAAEVTSAPAKGQTEAPTSSPQQKPTTAGTPRPTLQPSRPPTRLTPTIRPTVRLQKPTKMTHKPTKEPSNPTKNPTTLSTKPVVKPNEKKTTKPTRRRGLCKNGLKACLKKVRRICDCHELCTFHGWACPYTIVDNRCRCLRNKRKSPQSFNRGKRSIVKQFAQDCRCRRQRGLRRRAVLTRLPG